MQSRLCNVQEDRGAGAHNMGACPLARLSLLSMLNHGFVIEAVHGHEAATGNPGTPATGSWARQV